MNHSFVLLVFLFASANLNPCQIVTINAEGLHFQSIEVPFPTVYVHAGGSVDDLPESVFVDQLASLQVGDTLYRRLDATLKLSPYLYEHMLPFIPAMWEGWGGDRIPYVGEWQLEYDLLLDGRWQHISRSGKINPDCGIALAPGLAADADFNGSPSAFWNNQVVRQ